MSIFVFNRASIRSGKKICLLLLIAFIISGCNIRQGSVSISSDNIHFSKVTVNGAALFSSALNI